MKNKVAFLLIGVIPLLSSCASQRVFLAPVGPNPFQTTVASANTGYLKVFSEREAISEGDTPIFYQHSEYQVYNASGKLVKDVGNTSGHYDTAPETVPLPPGRYTVKARAKDYLSVVVPVVIDAGRTTSLHLDDRWQPPKSSPKTEFVFEPGGEPVGWRAGRSDR